MNSVKDQISEFSNQHAFAVLSHYNPGAYEMSDSIERIIQPFHWTLKLNHDKTTNIPKPAAGRVPVQL